MVTVGKSVKNFELPATGDKNLSLKDFKGRTLVLYFYPKDNTPGCTREGQDFRDAYDEFQAAGAEIVGVSRDSVRTHENFCAKQNFPFDLISDADETLCTHENFCAKQNFPFDLISDADETLCKQFDVIREKNMYGRKVMGVERSTFLIDGAGVLRAEWRKVRVPGHVDEVLEAVRGLD
ncbi:MAG: peroxiredoxin [Gammaproteobacteria bacterium]